MNDQTISGSLPSISRLGSETVSRKRYSRPELVALGDVRDATLGGSPGIGDSGSPTSFRPPGAGSARFRFRR